MRVRHFIGAYAGEVQDLPYHAAQALVATGQAALESAEDDPGLAHHVGMTTLSTESLTGDDDGGQAEKVKPKAERKPAGERKPRVPKAKAEQPKAESAKPAAAKAAEDKTEKQADKEPAKAPLKVEK